MRKLVYGGWMLLLMCGSLQAAWENPFRQAVVNDDSSRVALDCWRLYQLPELQGVAVEGSWQLPAGRMNVAVSRFGWSAYREISGTSGYSLMRSRLQWGIMLHIYRLQVRGYPPRQGVNSSCLLRYTPGPAWSAAITLRNWLPARCGELPVSRFDCTLRGADWLQLRLGWVEQSQSPPGALLGWRASLPGRRTPFFDYSFDTRSGQSLLAMSLQKGKLGWRVALLLHPQLGWSQQLRSEYCF